MAEVDLSQIEDYLVTQFGLHAYLGSASVTTIEARRDWSFPDADKKAMGFAHSELPGIIVQNRSMYGGKVEIKSLAKDCHEYKVPLVISGIMVTDTVERARDGAEILMEETLDALRKIARLPNKWGTDGAVDIDTLSGLYFHVLDSESVHYGICTVFCTVSKTIST